MEKGLTLCVRSDYPSKSERVEFDLDGTINQLRERAYQTLELNPEARYTMRSAAFGKDVVELDEEDMTAEEAGIKNRSTIMMFAPEALKPLRAMRSGREEAKEVKVFPDCPGKHGLTLFDTSRSGFGCDICNKRVKKKTAMHGCRVCDYDLCVPCFEQHTKVERKVTLPADELTPKKALQQLPIAKKKALKDALLKYIDQNAQEVLESSLFVKLPKKSVVELLSRKTLGAEEAVIFQAAWKWLGAHKEEPTKNVLELIRFPTMSVEELATVVIPTDALDQATTLSLFTYASLARTDDSKEITRKFGSYTFCVQERSGAIGAIVNMCYGGVVHTATHSDTYGRGYDIKVSKDRSITGFCVRSTLPGLHVQLYKNNGLVATTEKVAEFKHPKYKDNGWYRYTFSKPQKLTSGITWSAFFMNSTNSKHYYVSKDNNERVCADSDVIVESRYWSSNVSSKNTYALDFLMC